MAVDVICTHAWKAQSSIKLISIKIGHTLFKLATGTHTYVYGIWNEAKQQANQHILVHGIQNEA